MKYRKKPVVIDAIQWHGVNVDEVLSFVMTSASIMRKDCPGPNGGILPGGALVIPTLEGDMTAMPNDWIIKGIAGEIYPIKPDIFAKTYEPA